MFSPVHDCAVREPPNNMSFMICRLSMNDALRRILWGGHISYKEWLTTSLEIGYYKCHSNDTFTILNLFSVTKHHPR